MAMVNTKTLLELARVEFQDNDGVLKALEYTYSDYSNEFWTVLHTKHGFNSFQQQAGLEDAELRRLIRLFKENKPYNEKYGIFINDL